MNKTLLLLKVCRINDFFSFIEINKSGKLDLCYVE